MIGNIINILFDLFVYYFFFFIVILVFFTLVILILTIFTLIMQTNKITTFGGIFNIVNLKNSNYESEQWIFLLTLLAFPILNLYLAINIEVCISLYILNYSFIKTY